MTSRIIFVAVLCLVVTGCRHAADVPVSGADTIEMTSEDISVLVETCILKKDTFRIQRICNGRAEAYTKSVITVRNGGTVTKIHATEGGQVRKGDAIISLDDEEMSLSYQSSLLNFKKAEIALTDRLIDFGYRLQDTADMPEETLNVLLVKTGYAEARLRLAQAESDLRSRTVRAPFDGMIADLSCHLNEWCQGACCVLLDNSYTDLRFSLLEHEISMVSSGRNVIVSQFRNAENTLPGTIVSVNPSIDRDGQISATARVRNDGSLMDGMHVRIMLWDDLPDQLTVPHSAVVVRDGRNVVFKYAGGHAVWTYVNIVATNSTGYAIVPDAERDARLAEGDTIITSGNANLGDNTPVHLL